MVFYYLYHRPFCNLMGLSLLGLKVVLSWVSPCWSVRFTRGINAPSPSTKFGIEYKIRAREKYRIETDRKIVERDIERERKEDVVSSAASALRLGC